MAFTVMLIAWSDLPTNGQSAALTQLAKESRLMERWHCVTSRNPIADKGHETYNASREGARVWLMNTESIVRRRIPISESNRRDALKALRSLAEAVATQRRPFVELIQQHRDTLSLYGCAEPKKGFPFDCGRDILACKGQEVSTFTNVSEWIVGTTAAGKSNERQHEVLKRAILEIEKNLWK